MRYFCIITLGLGLFFVGIDVLKFASELPDSANLLILFILYDFGYALGFILPISLLLAEITTLSVLLRNNEFAALLSLGYSKKQIAMPIFCCAFILLLGFVALNATPFAYAREEAEGLINKNFMNRSKQEILVRHQNSYIYFDKIYPLSQRAENVRIYTIENDSLQQLVFASSAIFVEGKWRLTHVTLFSFAQNTYKEQRLDSLDVLQGFEPRLLDIIYEKGGMASILDAVSSFLFLQTWGLDSSRVRGVLYSLTLFPWFCMPMVAIILRFMPLFVRYGELGWFVFGSILMALISWGICFALSRFAMSGAIHPEWAFACPMLLWLLVGFVVYLTLNRYRA